MTQKPAIVLLLILTVVFGNLYAQENNPMSCRVKGRIISVLKVGEVDKKSVCAKYPCRAKVKVMDVNNCGSSVTVPLNIGDTVEMSFVYTLHRTKKIFPKMKARYPGMKKGNIFIAVAEQRNIIGGASEFIVYDYSLKK